jgi:chromosome segregation ATPase
MHTQGESAISNLETVELKLQLKAAHATAEHLSAKVHVLQQHLSSKEHSEQRLKTEYHQRISQLLEKVQQQEEMLGSLHERDQRNTETLRQARSAAASAAEQLNAKMQVLQTDLAAQSQVEQRLKEEYQAHIMELQDKLKTQRDRVLVLEEQYIGAEEDLTQLRIRESTFADQLQRLEHKCQRLEAERWEAMEAMSEMASTLVQCEKERREVERLRGEVHSQHKELEITRSSAQVQILRQQQQISAASITQGELEGILGQVSELQRGMETVERSLEARSMFKHGASLESGSNKGGTASSKAGTASSKVSSSEAGLMQQQGRTGSNLGSNMAVTVSSPAFELVRTLRSFARSASDLLTTYSLTASGRESGQLA